MITVAELIERAKNAPPLTEEDIQSFREHTAALERKYEQQAKDREVTAEALNRTYNL
jgi:hypothetical protein